MRGRLLHALSNPLAPLCILLVIAGIATIAGLYYFSRREPCRCCGALSPRFLLIDGFCSDRCAEAGQAVTR